MIGRSVVGGIPRLALNADDGGILGRGLGVRAGGERQNETAHQRRNKSLKDFHNVFSQFDYPR
jgi:hypothetical protein